jgi:hypothetical protein
MDETPHLTQNTASGRPHGTPGTHLRLPDLPDYKLGTEGDLNGFDATDSEFLQFVQSLVPLSGDNLEHWTWEERRDFLNWCLDEQVLTIKEGRMVPVEETFPTPPLTADPQEDAPGSAEGAEEGDDDDHDAAFIVLDPTTNENESTDEPAAHGTDEAQPRQDAVNALQNTEEGSGDAL